MTDETNTENKEVTIKADSTVATLGGRLGRVVAQTVESGPVKVFDLMDEALGEGENSFKTDEFFEKAQAFFEKTGLLAKFLRAKGIEVEDNISEWRPTLVSITTGKGKSAADLQHLPLNTLYNYGTKTAINVDDLFYPIFIHGEEILKDDSGMSVEDRIMVVYNSQQKAQTPGYDYQNIVYLVNRSLTEVYKITVKSSGHKFITNLLRNYMFANYSKGMMFNPATLKHWMKLDVVSFTSRSGFTNPYARLTVTETEVSSDEMRLLNIMQRSTFDDFRVNLAKSKEAAAEAQETQELLESNTVTDAAGDNFTQL